MSVLGFAIPALALRFLVLWPFQVIPVVSLIVHVEELVHRFS